MAALTSSDVKFNITSSAGAENQNSVHELDSIVVGGKTYSDFVGPDNVSFDIKDVKGENHEAKLFVGSESGFQSSLWPEDGVRNEDFEQQSLEKAFQSTDLNAFVDSLELSFKGEQSYTLGYDTPITVTEDGFVFITEKNGNNNQTVQFLDEDGGVLGEAVAVCRFEEDGNYLDLGVRTWSEQDIYASVFRLTDVEGLEEGMEIHSVKVILDVTPWGPNPKSGDGGDGKVFFFGDKEAMQPENNPPVAKDDVFTGYFGEDIEGNVLDNDFDPDDDPLTVISNTDPSNGTVVVNEDGTFVYTPNEGFFGNDSFSYTITDGRGGEDTAYVDICVLEEPCPPKNTPPVAVKDKFETEGIDQEFTGNVLDNDFDPDGDPISVLINTQPENGTVVMQEDGTFTYTPNAGFFGDDVFEYVVVDDRGGFDKTEVCIHVPCFATGTLIATAEGLKPVEVIRVGDRVLTRDDGYQEVRWAGQRVLDAEELAENPAFVSVMIKAGALGNDLPRRDLRVSPGHRMLISGIHAEMMFGERDVLVAASDLVGQPGIGFDKRPVTYVHIMFDRHQVIDSEGSWSESFQPADLTLNGLDQQQREELLALFPELASRKGQRHYAAARRVLASHEVTALMSM